MRKPCLVVFWVYVAAAGGAIAVIPLSDHSLLGLEPDALAGVFAILLSQPWTTLAFGMDGERSQTWNLVIVGLCLLLNAALLRMACRLFRKAAAGAGSGNRP